MALFEHLDDPHGMADVMETRSVIAAHLGHSPVAIAIAERVARLFEDTGRLLRIGFMRANCGYGMAALGKLDEGLALVEEALSLDQGLGDTEGEAYCLWHRGEILVRLGRLREARDSVEQGLALARRLGHREWTAAGLNGLGDVCLAEVDPDGAEAAFGRCLELAGRLTIFASWAAAGLAASRLARGDLAGADRYVAQALSEGTPLTHIDALHVQVDIARARWERDGDRV